MSRMDGRNGRRADFLTCLAERALGLTGEVQPLLRPRFGSTRSAPKPLAEELLAERIEEVEVPSGAPSGDARGGPA